MYRIFSVLNSRGLDLSYPDILKSEIVTTIPPGQQEDYVAKWEEIEALLGKEAFEDLFFYLRTIFSRERQRKGMIEEFHEYVYPGNAPTATPQEFIDKVLTRYAHALNYIEKANYQYGPLSKEINVMFKWLNQLDHHRWVAPALAYFFQHVEQHNLVLRFLTDLERLVVNFMLCRVPPYRRIDRYCDVLQAIYNKKDMFAADSPLQLKSGERRDMLRALDGNMYLAPHVCRYVLLRLDAKLSEGTASYDYQTISVEHVLPQRPAPDSQWMKTFPSREIRDRYVHRLGNMVLLSRGKNINAENVDFDEKKRRYFVTSGGISPFVLTTQVIQMREWTPAVIEQRQAQLLGVLKTIWNL